MFSQRIADLRPSPIREILAVIDRPGMVSFAGGLPATEMLPEWSGALSAAALSPAALQYGPSEGDPDLRAAVSEQLRRLGLDAPMERVMILSGSQQGIDLMAKLLIDAGTAVAVESPTYLAALQVFRLYGARFVDLPPGASSAASSSAASSSAASSSAASSSAADRARMAYVVPTFANPTGACASDPQREELARACAESGTTLFEDDPYRELAYGPCDRTPVAARCAGGSWAYQGSFSKTFAPGLRLGFLAASQDLFGPLVMLKQAVDLHSSRLSQRIVHDAIVDPAWGDRLHTLVGFYRERRDSFGAALDEHLGDLADWEAPAGGLFFWLRLRSELDTRELLGEAIARGVAFMPGEEFYAGEPQLGTMRLNFSHAPGDEARRGLSILAGLIRERTRALSGVSR